MADVNCYGSLISTRYTTVPLLRTDLAEATQEEVKTDSNFVGSNQTAGTFASQQFGQFVLAKAGIVCENDMTFAFIQSAGKIKAALPMGSGLAGGSAGLPAPLPYPKQLLPGDSVQVMSNAVSDRQAAVSVACSSGEYHVFEVTASGAGEHEFVSVLDGQGIGTTLQGRVITHWFALSGNNDAELTSPVYLLDGSGVPTDSVGFSSSGGSVAGTFQQCQARVALNSRLVYRTDA